MSDWQPTATLHSLTIRARALSHIREFFSRKHILEVETPLLGSHTVTDPNIESFVLEQQLSKHYLQTSPEYSMKRLLAAGMPDIYQICKCFRQSEQGDKHNPEFTIIEWYRLGFSLQQIMNETVDLICAVLSNSNVLSEKVEYITYANLFEKILGKSFFELSETDFDRLCSQYGMCSVSAISLQQKIDFSFSHIIAPQFDSNKLTCVFDYPAEQAALAKLNVNDNIVAQRFEVFCGPLELANGYVELTDPDIQLTRFNNDQVCRKANNQMQIDIDQRLIDAQKFGLPDCAGVAVGLDRLLMLLLDVNSIDQVMSFSWRNA